MRLSDVCQLRKGSSIAEWDEGDTVMSEGREDRNNGQFLPTTKAAGGDEHASKLAIQLALLPEVAGTIKECL